MDAMLSRFRSRPKRTDRLPEGLRLYAIGDIHGRRDLMDALLRQIEDDLAGWSGDSEVVFLGDYVDRGNASAAVLDRLAEGPPQGQRWTLLKGNHESILSHLISDRPREDESLYPAWLKHGGRETLASYSLPAALAFGRDRCKQSIEFIITEVLQRAGQVLRQQRACVRSGFGPIGSHRWSSSLHRLCRKQVGCCVCGAPGRHDSIMRPALRRGNGQRGDVIY